MDEFESFIREIDACIKEARINTPELKFADTAMNFLEKAFVSRDAAQLLWHITTIEAILGEKVDSGLTKLLSTRLSRALRQTPQERKQIRKVFEELYSFRSDLVHGNEAVYDRDIFLGHLGQARELARLVTVWLLHYLPTVRQRLKEGAKMPSRENLLTALDNFEESRAEISALLEILPKDFPNPADW